MPPVTTPIANEASRWRWPLHFPVAGRSDPVEQSGTVGHSTGGHSAMGNGFGQWSSILGDLGHGIWYEKKIYCISKGRLACRGLELWSRGGFGGGRAYLTSFDEGGELTAGAALPRYLPTAYTAAIRRISATTPAQNSS